MSEKYLLLLFFAVLTLVQSNIWIDRAQDELGCYTHDDNCNECINHNPTNGIHPCGICGDTGECLPGNPSGPDLAGGNYSNFGGCPNRWQHQDGSMVIQQFIDFPVSPTVIDIYMKPNDDVEFIVTVTRPLSDEVPIELIVVQDSSASMIQEMDLFARLVPRVMSNMFASFKESQFGYVQYIEKPQHPMSQRNTYSFSMRTHATEEAFTMLKASYKAADQNIGNQDNPEDVLTAMLYSAVCGDLLEYRENSRKIFFVAGDACYHDEGWTEELSYHECIRGCHPGRQSENQMACSCLNEKSGCGSNCNNADPFKQWANQYECFHVDSPPPGTTAVYNDRGCPYSFPKKADKTCVPMESGSYDDSKRHLWGELTDYPSKELIKEVFLLNNIYPIFAISANSVVKGKDTWNSKGGYEGDEEQCFLDLIEYLGFGIYFDMLSNNGDALAEALVAAIDDLAGKIQLIETDVGPYTVTYLTPNPPIFSDVPELESREFLVRVGSSSPTDHTLTLVAVGFDTVAVNLYTSIPCFGCDGVAMSDVYTDDCGVCEPEAGEENACYGCDGIPYSGLEVLLCGCDDDTSCLGCDGLPDSGKIIDICGVCGGDNMSCYGCDEEDPYNGKYFDLCGVCGGDNDCYGCDGVINSNLTVDECGVCNGSNTCFGCDGIAYSGLVEDVCGECGGDGSKCVGCDGLIYDIEIEEPLGYDICGICGGNGTTCDGCDGVPASGKIVDACGVCEGTDDCLGCDGVINSGLEFDDCFICDGNNSCLDCAGVPYGDAEYDICGVCNGNNDCLGCDGVPNSGLVTDDCDICNGTGQTCLGCDGVPKSGLELDSCGICNGNNSCLEPPIELQPEIVEVVPTGVIVSISVAAAAIAGIVIFSVVFFGVQSAINPSWYLMGSTTGATVHSNPTYQNSGKNVQNPLFEGKGNGGAGAGGDGGAGAGGDGAGGNGGADDSS
eukprot:TRINITY_DN11561_c0_g1_i1.p1 TRINITY_DN11561_c0_g1~~TRINITY_DN11561_c0_g1_i1.p1  ORF type:complete len:952 (-),score=257.72 TRINITY_DN11561_c0_g1_i1:65-2920(-)